MVDDISMEDMPSLLEAEIGLSLQFFENQVGCNWNGLVNLFKSIRPVKSLTLDKFSLMALSHSGLSLKFQRLTNLTLKAGCCKWSSLQELLEASDSLEYLTLKLHFTEHQHEPCWTKPKKVPPCLTCLKEMSIEGFCGHYDECALLGYILKNASRLETMKIKASYHLKLREKHQLLQQLSKIRRLSNMCQVIFP